MAWTTSCCAHLWLEAEDGRPVSHLVDMYARHGFVVDGDEYLEDGIPHTLMRLA